MNLREMAAYITNTCADNDRHEDELDFTIGVNLETIVYLGFTNGDSMGDVELKEIICEHINDHVGLDDTGSHGLSATWPLEDLNPRFWKIRITDDDYDDERHGQTWTFGSFKEANAFQRGVEHAYDSALKVQLLPPSKEATTDEVH